MNVRTRFYCKVWLILCFAIVACTARKIDLPMEKFEVAFLSLPENWQELDQGQDGYRDENVVAVWQQRWGPNEAEMWIGLGYSVGKFESIALAKRDYRHSLKRFQDQGFYMVPLSKWQYTSPFADQYAMYCSFPETTGEFCYAVMRYRNFTVVLGLDPGEGVTLEDCPELFGLIDEHVYTIISNNTDE